MKYLATLALLFVASCCAPDKAYVEATASYFDVVTPEWIRYVDADATLDAAQKQRRKNLATTASKTIQEFKDKVR